MINIIQIHCILNTYAELTSFYFITFVTRIRIWINILNKNYLKKKIDPSMEIGQIHSNFQYQRQIQIDMSNINKIVYVSNEILYQTQKKTLSQFHIIMSKGIYKNGK